MIHYPQVKLLTYTPNPEQVIVHATRTCYDSYSKSSPDTDCLLIQKCIGKGHESVLEHATATFDILCSRVVSHELVRHRLASYSQRSQRFVNEVGSDYFVLPPEIVERGEEALVLYDTAMRTTWHVYQELIRLGVSKQIARYVLPNAWQTRVIATFNFRELRHIITLRGHKQAQPEFRSLALKMLVLCLQIAPNVFSDLRSLLDKHVPEDVKDYMEEVSIRG